MYKRILVPLDGSETAEAILPHVQALAKCHGSEVILLRVVVDPVFDYALADPAIGLRVHDDLEAEAKGYLARVISRLAEAGITAHAVVAAGPVAASILDHAAEVQVDLIAMSTHGRGGLERLLLGSVAEQVVQHAPRPVLIVRPH